MADELLLEYYKAAKAESVQRIVLRDQMTIAYIVAIGSYSAFVITQLTDQQLREQPELWTGIALGLPLMCLVFASFIIQHHVVISQLGNYIEHELTKAGAPVEWERSNAIKSTRILKSRVIAQLAISVFPTGLSVHITHRMSVVLPSFQGVALAYWVEAIVFIAILLLHAYAFAFRMTAGHVKATPNAA